MEETSFTTDPKSTLKYNIRGLVFNQDPVLRYNLLTGTQILYSEAYPTQVFRLKGVKYIRVNAADISALPDDQAVTDLLKLLLSIDDYSHREDQPEPDITDVITEAVDQYQSFTGEDLRDSDIIDADDVGNIINPETLPIKQKTFKAVKSGEDSSESDATEDSEVKEGADMTKDASDMASATGMTEDPASPDASKPEKREVMVDLREVEQSLEDVKHYKDLSKFSSKHGVLEAKDIVMLNAMVKKLLKAFKGNKSKQKRITPRKHISAKAMAMDAEKIYIDKNAPTGKHIEFNLLIDMSGSMGGDPVKNAVSLIYLFNKLAQQGYVTGHVLYSTSNYNYPRAFPMPDAEVLSLCKTLSSEGLAETVDQNVDILRNINCICITDGNIVDRPIDKMFWRKHKIVSTGVYINPSMEDPLAYSGKLDKWFDHSLVRKNLDEMVQLLIKIGLKG